jgi:hypothetical protein
MEPMVPVRKNLDGRHEIKRGIMWIKSIGHDAEERK